MTEQVLRLRYFAWVRERIGYGAESVTLPAEVRTVEDLIGWLSARDARYEAVFAGADTIRIAVGQKMAQHDTPLAGAAEVAFFPPMTGG